MYQHLPLHTSLSVPFETRATRLCSRTLSVGLNPETSIALIQAVVDASSC